MTIAPELEAIRELHDTIGAEFGVTDWQSISQMEADIFATLTDDWDFMHNDPEWAKDRFNGTINSGLHVLSLFPRFIKEVGLPIPAVVTETAYALSYGYDRIRYVSPLNVGQRFRDHVSVIDITEKRPGEFLVRTRHSVEKEGDGSPFMVADWLAYVVTGEAAQLVSL